MEACKVFGSVVLALAILVLNPPQAVPADSGCQVCLYEHDTFRGKSQCYSQDVADLHAQGLGDRLSSFAFAKDRCPDLHVILYKDKQFHGDSMLVNQDADKLEGGWNDKVSSLRFLRQGPVGTSKLPECGVCLYDEPQFRGASACFAAGEDVIDLRRSEPEFNDRAASVQLFRQACPDMQAAIFEHTDYRGRHQVLTGDAPSLDSPLRDKVTGLQIWRFGPRGEPVGDPQACFAKVFDLPGYKGSSVTIWENSGLVTLEDMDKRGSSIFLGRKGCPGMTATFWTGKDRDGHMLEVTESIPILPDAFDNELRSGRIFPGGVGDPKDCGICLYDQPDFRGREVCLSVSSGHLGGLDFNDKASSIRIHTRTCPEMSAMVFDMDHFRSPDMNMDERNEAYWGWVNVLTFGSVDWEGVDTKIQQARDDGARVIFRDEARLGALDNEITSVLIDPNGVRLDPRKAVQGCGVCFYKDPDFTGLYRCLNRDDAEHPGRNCKEVTYLFDDFCLHNGPSSLLVFKEACPQAVVGLYSDENFQGRKLVVDRDVRDMAQTNMGDDNVKSARFDPTGRQESASWTECGVCLHDGDGFKGPKVCFGESVPDLDQYSFNDKANSVGLIKDKCPDLVVQLFEHKGYQGDKHRLLTGSVSMLNRLLSGKVSSVRLYKEGADGPWTRTQGCGFCLFVHEDFTGDWTCFSGATRANLDHAFAGKASGVWIDKERCPRAELILFSRTGQQGDQLVLNDTVGDLGRRKFNDKARSVSFEPHTEDAGSARQAPRN